MSYIGDHVWLITSRQTEPDLCPICISFQTIGSAHERNLQFIDVWVENAVDETDARALVGVLIRQFNMKLPVSPDKWR